MRKLFIICIVLLLATTVVPGAFAQSTLDPRAMFEQSQRQLAQRQVAEAERELAKIREDYGEGSRQVILAERALEEAREDLAKAEDVHRRAEYALTVATQQQALAADEARLKAVARVDALREEIAALAADEDAVSKLQAELEQARLDQLRSRYAALAEQADRLAQLLEVGRAQPSDHAAANAEAEQAFAELREAELESMLEQVRRERMQGAANALVMPGRDTLVMPERSTTRPAKATGLQLPTSSTTTTRPAATVADWSPSDPRIAVLIAAGVPPQYTFSTLSSLAAVTPADPTRVDRQVLEAEFFRGYLDTVQRYGELASDPAAARVAAVITAADMLADEPEKAIEFLQQVIREIEQNRQQVSDRSADTVLRIARLQLADFHRQAQNDEAALDELRRLATGAQ